MPARVCHRRSVVHSPKSLAVRGGLVPTFGGLASLLVVTFLCAGIYILEDAVANPLAAQAAVLIFGAFIIAAAAMIARLSANVRRVWTCGRCAPGTSSR